MFSIFLFLVCFLFTMGFLRGQVCPHNWSLTTLCLYLLLLVGKVDFFSLFLVCGTCRIWHLINVSGVSIYLFPPLFPLFSFFFLLCNWHFYINFRTYKIWAYRLLPRMYFLHFAISNLYVVWACRFISEIVCT